MNSDKQGRAMCACGSSGAAPGAEPAAAAPQCRCRTAPRAPSPAQNITAAIAAADLTGTGFLRLRSFAASNAQPVPDVIVTISQRSGTGIPDKTVTTGPEALSDDVAIACPPRSYSLDENNRTVLPYAVVDVTAEHEGYDPVHVAGVQVFDSEVSLLELLMIPVEEDETAAYTVRSLPEDFDIPTHKLFEGGESSGPTPLSACRPRILDQPIIPEKITVHLGRPSANVQNVTVSFRDYIKNVASSEVYPTWPEQALRANIHAQISLALNRVYTEWYRSKGYNFQITSSTSYDQYYVHGRNIFEVMSRITDDIFNTYVRRIGTIDPYYTEYCDGKTVSCPGMKQWGTVTLANQGRNALSILQYYYGNNIEIVRTNNIQAIPESYPGTPLRLGSTGNAVRTIQRQLNRIARNYPFFGTLEVDGVFGASTEAVVKKFQKQFSLAQDGVVGRDTWYKISYIYVAVKKLAELSSEGEAATGNLVAGQWPGTLLRVGSRGDDVEQIQFWLNAVAEFVDTIPTVTVDGIFGQATDRAVRAFQQHFGLTVDGIVGQATWNSIYNEYSSIQTDIAPPNVDTPGQFPGTTLAVGSRGNDVKQMQFYLRIISNSNSAIPAITADGIFGSATERAVRAFQQFYGLTVDGLVGKLTWNKSYEVYTGIINGLLAPTERPGTYPGAPLRIGSTGRAVKEVQYYLYLMSAYYTEIPVIAFDGIYGTATAEAVRAYQRLFGLAVDGVVGPATWNSIYNQFSTLRNVDGPVNRFRVFAYPGYDLQEGMSGSMVQFVQFMLAYIGSFYDTISPITVLDGEFGPETKDAVESFQREFAFAITGIVDEPTWAALVITYLSLASDEGENDLPEGEYPGFVLAIGSAGPSVRRLQRYMNGIASRFCVAWFVPESGIFDEITLNAVKEFQEGFGLPVTGLVDRATWDAIYNYYIMEEE